MPLDAREFLRRLFSGRKPRSDAGVEVLAFPEAEDNSPTGQLLGGSWVDVTIHQKPGSLAYDEGQRQLFIRYPDDTVYVYDGVSPLEATSLLAADHKGSWVWDHLRIRGTLNGAQKPYARVSGGTVRLRKDVSKKPVEHDFPGWTPL